MNLDLVSWTVTAPGAGGAAMTPVAGDSAQIRNGNGSIMALAAWTNAQAVGSTGVLWPSGHDLVRGFRFRNVALNPANKLGCFPARFRAQDPVTVTQAGSAVGGDVETYHMLMHYEDLPGVAGRLINVGALKQRGMQVLTIEFTVTATGAGAYSGVTAINAANDLLKAGTDYAILGAQIGANGGALTLRGVDNGGLRYGIPCLTNAMETANWFADLSMMHGVPAIPVFNSANRAGMFAELVTNEILTAVPMSLNLVELGK